MPDVTSDPSATPAPWTALPAPAALGHPDGTWLVVGPRGDRGEPHTVAVCLPCDDGTHPAARAHADAQAIARAVSAMAELDAYPMRGATVLRLEKSDVLAIGGLRRAFAEMTAEDVERIQQHLTEQGIPHVLLFDDRVDISKLTAADLRAALALLERQ